MFAFYYYNKISYHYYRLLHTITAATITDGKPQQKVLTYSLNLRISFKFLAVSFFLFHHVYK